MLFLTNGSSQTSFQKRILFVLKEGGKEMSILQQGALTEKVGSFMKNNELQENYSGPFRSHMLPF